MPDDVFKKLPKIWLNTFWDRQSTLVPTFLSERRKKNNDLFEKCNFDDVMVDAT